jgi:hypothetical protein
MKVTAQTCGLLQKGSAFLMLVTGLLKPDSLAGIFLNME